MVRVGIIGGGPTGIVLAQELVEAGHDVVLFESKDRVGGLFYKCYEGAMLTSSMTWTAFSKFPPSLAGWNPKTPLHWSADEFAEY